MNAETPNFPVVSISVEIYGFVGCVGGGFSRGRLMELPGLRNIYKANPCSCRLPCAMGGVGGLEATVRETVRSAPAMGAKLEDRLGGRFGGVIIAAG